MTVVQNPVDPASPSSEIAAVANTEATVEAKRKRDLRPSDIIGPLVVFALFIGLWYFMHYWGLRHLLDRPPHLITPPHEVIDEAFMEPILRRAILEGLKWTAFTAIIGLMISIVLGMTLAVIMSQARWVERSIWPYLVALQAIPILAVVPIIAIVFGYGLNARILVTVMISIFPIVSNTLFGLLSVDPGQHDLFTLRRASRWTRLWKLQLPAAMPSVFTGFRIAAGLSVIGAVVGEQFFTRGRKKGVGRLLVEYASRTNYPAVYACLILAVLLGISEFIFFGWLQKLAVGRWYVPSRQAI